MHGIYLPTLVLRGERDVVVIYFPSPSIWNGTRVERNLDYGGTILEQVNEFVERRHKSNMMNMVTFLNRERLTR